MKEDKKAREELLKEVKELRRRVKKLETRFKQVEKESEKSEKKYTDMFELAPDAIAIVDLRGMIKFCNSAFLNYSGFSRPEIEGKHFAKLPALRARDIPGYIKIFSALARGKVPEPFELEWVRKDGNPRVGEIHIALTKIADKKTRILVIAKDITERKLAEEALKASLTEKEVLLKEIHHRVKNNLQIITSLLNLQAGYIKDRQALRVFQNSQERIRAMALVHEELYKASDLSKIDFSNYIHQLVSPLFNSYALAPGQVRLEIELEDILLDMKTAIPLGLIVNELTSNALKHAFPGNRKGKLSISLDNSEDEAYDLTLVVADNGIGFPDGRDFRNGNSLGMVLVCSLVKQLHGVIDLDRENGTTFTIKFKKLMAEKPA